MITKSPDANDACWSWAMFFCTVNSPHNIPVPADGWLNNPKWVCVPQGPVAEGNTTLLRFSLYPVFETFQWFKSLIIGILVYPDALGGSENPLKASSGVPLDKATNTPVGGVNETCPNKWSDNKFSKVFDKLIQTYTLK